MLSLLKYVKVCALKSNANEKFQEFYMLAAKHNQYSKTVKNENKGNTYSNLIIS